MAERSWYVVRVELVSGLGEEVAPAPGRDFLVSSSHSLMELALAIDSAFARWDLGHLHLFQMPDGRRYMLGGGDEEDTPSTESTQFELLGLTPGVRFEYVFDLGDEWVHRCEVRAVDVDAREEFGDEPLGPAPLFGWGFIPDQYGRRTPDD